MSSVVVAAVAPDGVAPAVVEVAARLAQVLHARLDLVHVVEVDAADEPAAARTRAATALAGLQPRLLEGDPALVLAGEVAVADAELLVLGCRGAAAGPRPAGHVVLDLLGRVRCPVLAVPPGLPAGHELAPVLVPLDGSESASDAVRAILPQLAAAGIEALALHVTPDQATPPPALDHHRLPVRRLDVVVGEPAEVVLARVRTVGAGLIVLGWSRHLETDRAPLVRSLLAGADVPVLLLPRRLAAPEPDLHPAPLEVCPGCGAGDLVATSDGVSTNFFCPACRQCWHVELGWVRRVVPSTCPGCALRDVCRATGRFDVTAPCRSPGREGGI